MKENKRKCLKCGSSPAEDPNITLYRFPKPGTKNLLRCELWAKYCFPQEAWHSAEFQRKLHNEHRMLCHKHFKNTSFIDFLNKKLHRHAAPNEECDEMVSQQALIIPTAPPVTVFTNVLCPDTTATTSTFPTPGPSTKVDTGNLETLSLLKDITNTQEMVSQQALIIPTAPPVTVFTNVLCPDTTATTSTFPKPGPSTKVDTGNLETLSLLKEITNTQEMVSQQALIIPTAPPVTVFTNVLCPDTTATTSTFPKPGPSTKVDTGNLETLSLLKEITNTQEIVLQQSLKPTALPLTILPEEAVLINQPLLKKRKEMTEKEKYLYKKCRRHIKNISRLQKTINKLKNRSFLQVLSEDDSVNELINTKMPPIFGLLLQAQLKNFKKKSKGRRWNTETKITALRLYKRSPTCYRLLRRLFCLPAQSTLKSLLNKFPISVGINSQIFRVLNKFVKTQKPSDNAYILMFDQMSIKKNLYYNKKEDIIEGFQDHASQGRTPEIASYALVFMVAGIRKKVKQPIAYFFSGGSVTADILAVLLKDVLHHCFDAGLDIFATVCDLDGVNKRALGILGASIESPFIEQDNREVVTLFDTPHLLKSFRNLFFKYNIQCTTNLTSDAQKGLGIAKWEHIREFHRVDSNNPNFVFAPCLKKEHLDPNTRQKMKVKLAAQVLSHSVAAGMYAKISQGELPADAVVTANIISNMDKLFDSVNADSPDLRRGKPHSTNLTEKSFHMRYFHEMKTFFGTMKFIGSKYTPPSQNGWIWTLNGIECLWNNLSKKHPDIKSLATRRLQQDPLENLFGCIRGNCGANVNPTVGQFVAGLKTSILSNLSHMGVGNCEYDTNDVIFNNFKTFLLPPTINEATGKETNLFFSEIENAVEDTFEDSIADKHNNAELQACAYVCGFLLKNNKNVCENCQRDLRTEEQNIEHIFIAFKEYNEIKKSLNYAARDFIVCVEHCATIVNSFLDKNAHLSNLMKRIKPVLQTSVNFNFLKSCETHKHATTDYIINSVFFICIKRFCVLQNRQFTEQASMSALKRKIDILKHK